MKKLPILRISKNNALINASYRLTLTEMQIVLYGIGLMNPIQPDFPRSYRIDIDRFAKMFGRQHKDIYKEVKAAVVKRFWERDFSYVDEKGKTVVLRWLTKMVYEDKSGYLEIKFSEEIQPYLSSLQGNFTAYYIDQIANFKSIYSVRFYEYALMFLNKNNIKKGIFSLLISEIKEKLDIVENYKLFSNFKLKVLNPAKKEINQFSDIVFDYSVEKLGRTPHKIKFKVSKKDSYNEDSIEHKSEKLQIKTLESAKEIVIKAGTGWDIYAIEKQFYEYLKEKGSPKNVDAAFIGFVKKKISNKA
mgnify:CR=1 FL=1